MVEVTIEIGNRSYQVACQEGEEHFLHAAAHLLNSEAETLTGQIGRLPENRMLLMSGLMLADKAAGLSEELEHAKTQLAETKEELEALINTPPPVPDKIEVPVVPPGLRDSLAELAARAEALADQMDGS